MMNLKTHTAYQEVQVNPHGVFTVRFVNSEGKTVFEDMGAGKDQDDINQRVAKMVADNEPGFRKGAARKIVDFIKGDS